MDKYEKRISELQDTCHQWERLSKEAVDAAIIAERKRIGEKLAEIRARRASLSPRTAEYWTACDEFEQALDSLEQGKGIVGGSHGR